MKFISKYTWSNICANKLRAVLLISCIAFASILFFVSLAFPLYLRNYHEGTMRSYFGNSDIYMQATDSTIATLDDLPVSVSENLEYAYGFLALPSTKYSTVTKQEEPITYIAGNFADVQDFNPVHVLSGDTNNFTGRKAAITQSTADKFGWKVGQSVRVAVYGKTEYFQVVAIVANEGLLSTQNESKGPIVLISKDGVYSVIRDVMGESADGLSDAQLNRYFNMAVFKVKNGADVPGVASDIANEFPTFDVNETVNNKVLNQAVSYLKTPFVACIYLVCGFCALIIYLTCRLTFAERVRQFAVLKAMGSTTAKLFFSLLLESAFYGLCGGVIAVGLAALQVYLLPVAFSNLTYIVPVPTYYYVLAVLFGVVLAVASSFIEALKVSRKSIKETLIRREKFETQNKAVSIISVCAFIVFAIVLIAVRKTSVKILSIPMFLLALFSLLVALPFVLYLAHWTIKRVFKKRSFESLYLEKTLPSKNLSVANRLLFFGMFLVFLFSCLISSLETLSVSGRKFEYDIIVSQANQTDITNENIEQVKAVEGVERVWLATKIEDALIEQNGEYLANLYGIDQKEIERLYSGIVSGEIAKNMSGKILLNKYFRDTRGFKKGDVISLNMGVRTVQTVEFEIVGFIDNYENYGNMAVCLRADLEDIDNVDGFNTIYIKAKQGADVDSVISSVRALPFIGQTDSETEAEYEATAKYLTFTNVAKQTQIFVEQMQVPFLILRTYSILVLILSLLCIFIGYVLYLRESSEYHKTLFALGMSPNRFMGLVVRQSVFMTIASMISAMVLSVLLLLNFENIFNALGTSFTTHVDYFEYGMYALGLFAGTTLMSLGLGLRFKKELMSSDKRLFG